MAQSNSPTLKTTGSNSNIAAMVSSTPIRIGSGAGSFHGTHATEPRPASVATETFDTITAGGQQSSSVPTAHTLAALNTAAPAATAAAITGTGMSAVFSSSLTPPNSAGLRQSGGG